MWLPSLAIVLALGAGVSSFDDDMAELAQMIREDCIDQTSVDASLIDKVNAGADLTPDPKLKCYIKCVMETAGMMSDGVINVDAILGILPEEMKRKNEGTIRTCGSQPGSDDCDIAYQTQACWQKSNKKDYILI